jgi:hypothetical protein
VSASEFAFLVLGLILGIPTGIAVLVVLRARPSTPRQVRVTVAPDSVPRRRSATLADDPFIEREATAATGGPADSGRPQGLNRERHRSPTIGVSDASVGPTGRGDQPAAPPDPRTPVLAMAGDGSAEPESAGRLGVGAGRDMETPDGFPVRSGVDPILASFQQSAANRPNTASGGPDSASRAGPAVRSSGIALLETAVEARESERANGTADILARSDDARPSPAGGPSPAGTPAFAGTRAQGSDPQNGTSAPAGNAAATDPPAAESIEAAAAPCATERRAMTELCALAERMQSQADGVADQLRQAQRTYDTHLSAADQAEAVADPRVQRAAKDAAQHAFRRDRGNAASREEVEAAARTWLQEINRINGEAREAAARLAQERRAATSQVAMIERLTVAADALRVQAEAAREACLNAREALAACEESRAAVPPVARMPLAPSLAPGEVPPAMPDAGLPLSPATLMARALRTPPRPDDAEADALAASMIRGEGQPAILRLLSGDRAAFEVIVATLGGDDPAERRRWQIHLSGLVDALVARAIDACAFDFPEEHFFWGPFTRDQCRDIALALSSLGFRFDGLGGFADERVPSQRDLSLAVGFAGLDPMRIRRWPTEAEMVELFRDVAVAADEYVAGAAAGLTLGELVTLLGRRADGLTEVWNAWGRIRPRLLEPI